MAVLFATTVAGCAESEQSPGSLDTAYPEISLYSPAAPPIVLWSINKRIGETLKVCAVGNDVKTIAQALPDSVNTIGKMPERANHFPIVTTVDFSPAIRGTGPGWHRYDRAHPDLKFIASLYEVGIGVMAFNDDIRMPADLKGKRIAVPRRPSSLRMTAEALLRDGWGILDDVALIDMPPNTIVEAATSGHIDATTWNMIVETPDGLQPLLPGAMNIGHWIPVSDSAVARINAANDFATEAVSISIAGESAAQSGGDATLLSFRQALAAWSSSGDSQVLAILQCLEGEYGLTVGTMSRWPGLQVTQIHPAALKYYRRSIPNFLQNDDL